ncbi:hypothetical protein BYT27DRAFT_7258982 [Phlegmacium glaucopus]|nr:hypothetical protein BYT27DRAFT_7258982 [Phlegmacium glaucopus]
MADSESNSMPTTLAGEKLTTMMDMNVEDEKQLGIFRIVTQFLLRRGIETHGPFVKMQYRTCKLSYEQSLLRIRSN